MNLSEYLKNEERARLELAWRHLTPMQKKILRARAAVGSVGQKSLHWLNNHIEKRRARFAYIYQAHWVKG